MSNPSSRLSAFRSYSYYHVLVMCDSSNTADLLAKSQMPDVWAHATPETKAPTDRPGIQDLGRFSPKCIKDEKSGNACAGRYLVLIDGSTDAAFSITNARWTSATAAAAVPQDGNTSLAVEGQITISEPKGIAFLDQVVKCSVALGVDSSQVVYCLKTFFVGMTFDPFEGDRAELITDIPPIQFITYDVTGGFTEAGGSYEMMFVALTNGASRLPQYSKAVNSMNITAGDTLYSTMKRLELNILENYNKYYDCVVAQLSSIGTEESQRLLDSLCRVNYVIEVGKEYQSERYQVTNQPAQVKNTSGCTDNAQIHFPTNTSIETAISTIMQMSPQVRDDMTTGDDSTKVKHEYKVHSCVESRPVEGSDIDTGKLEYTVYYRVEQFKVPKSLTYDPVFQLLASDDVDEKLKREDDPAYVALKRNIIEFDYLYTGKNIDILEFDIKVNMGMAYIQTATLANTFRGQLERAAVKGSSPAQQDAALHMGGKMVTGTNVQTPVFFGKQIGTPTFINAVDTKSSIQSAYTLSKHASLEVAEAAVKIVGNDMLLTATNQTSSPSRLMKKSAPDMKTENEATSTIDWTLVPAYAKINIKMPRNNDDVALFSGHVSNSELGYTSNADYAQQFWFDGYYYIYGIEHSFDGGEFTQNLQMISIPKTSTFESTKQPPKDVTFDQNVDKCFDNVIGCGPQTSSTAEEGTPVVAIPPINEEYNKLDADTINKMATSLSSVKGWNTAKPEVREAIINAAKQYGVNPVTLAQMCYQESKFNPSAKNPNSSATGLFQFINSTWSVNGVGADSRLTPSVLADKKTRLNPQINAYAGAKYLAGNISRIGSSDVGDVYLAHFAGPGIAKRTVRLDKSTNGTATLRDVYYDLPKTLNNVVKANSPYIYHDMTVREFRNWAARKMAGTLTTPVTTATNVNPKVTTSGKAKLKSTPQQPTVARGDSQAVHKKKATDRKAKEALATQQDCKTQETKTDAKPCASQPTESPAVQSTAEGSISGAEIGPQ